MKRSPEFYANWKLADLKKAQADYAQRTKDYAVEGHHEVAIKFANMCKEISLAIEARA